MNKRSTVIGVMATILLSFAIYIEFLLHTSIYRNKTETMPLEPAI